MTAVREHPNPRYITKLCGDARHGWCPGRVDAWDDGANSTSRTDCRFGCGCSPRVPLTRPGAARARRRQLVERAEKAERRRRGETARR